jgi:glycosyltransferase involved in cell wall biosynthesis
MESTSVYILAKDEEANIGRCLDSLQPLNIEVKLLDSGSCDRTIEIAKNYDFVQIESYLYKNHLTAYNYICGQRTQSQDYALILDADMILTEELREDVIKLIKDGNFEIVAAPVQMYWNGHLLRYGSLYPPKPFLFRGGQQYFMPYGHGEKLLPQYKVFTTRGKLIHDDRKEWVAWLLAQDRYGSNLIERWREGKLSRRDQLRIKTPIMVFLAPLWSLIMQFGFLAGKVGLLYAMDRLIAEAIQYRKVLAYKIVKKQ